MRRIRVDKSKVKSAEMISHNNKIKLIVGLAVAVVLILAFVLIAIEDNLHCKYVIENHTDKNITNIEVVFEDEAGYTIQDIYDGALNSGASVKGKFQKEDFRNNPGDLWIYVQFEGENPLMIYDGYLYTLYDGHFSLDFVQEDGEYRLNTDSGVGLFGGKDIAGIDSKIQLVFDEQDWHYMSYSKTDKKWYPDLDGEIDLSEIEDDADEDEEVSPTKALSDDEDIEEAE